MRKFVFTLAVGLVAIASSMALIARPALAADPAARAFTDVPPNSWAYQAIAQLYKDGIIQGYPDGSFRGDRPLSRFEVAAILSRAIAYIEKQLANPATASGIKPQDMDDMRKLISDFSTDMPYLRSEMVSLKDANDRFQTHVYSYVRAPGTFSSQVDAFDGTGKPLPPGTIVSEGPSFGARPSVCCGPNTEIVGNNARGNGYQLFRIILNGDLSNHFSWFAILGDINFYGASPGNFYATSLNELIAQVNYNDPSGFFATVGKFVSVDGPFTSQADEPQGLLWSDFFTGGEVGYKKNGWDVYGAYSFNNGSDLCKGTVVSGGICQGGLATGEANQTIFGHVDYQLNSKWNLSAGYIIDRGIPNETVWDSSVAATTTTLNGPACTIPTQCGAYVNAEYPLPIGAVGAMFQPTPYFRLGLEGARRLGNDPSTGSHWTDSNAFKATVHFGHFEPKQGNGYVTASFLGAGFNSLGAHAGPDDVPDYYYAYAGNLNGYRSEKLGLEYWVSPRVRIGVVGLHWNVNPKTSLPLGGGNYMTKDDHSALTLDTLINF